MNKYRAVRTEVDGITFASKKEAARYCDLKTLQNCGIISGLELQPKFPLVVNGVKLGTYIADFQYRDQSGRMVIEDTKGVRTPVYRIKAKLMLAIHNVRILEL